MAVRTLEKDTWAISSPLHNKLAPEDRSVHAWYRFVLSFPPHLVRKYLTDFGLDSSSTVLDPFCGTGTTLVEAKKRGIKSVGIEANAIASLASQTKIDWTPDPAVLIGIADGISARLKSEFRELNLRSLESGIAERCSLYGLRCLDAEAESLLLQGSICPINLHQALILLELISTADVNYQKHLKLALAWALVNDIGNIRFGPEVGITPPKGYIDVLSSWHGQVFRMSMDLCEVGFKLSAPSKVCRADSRSAVSGVAPRSIDAIITSPPYPNEKDYTRTTRLESVVLDMIRTKRDLRELKKTLVRSNTRSVYVDDMDHTHVADIPEIQRIAEQIEARRIELGKTSGFERLYHRVTKLYFGGMAMHFKEMSALLKPGAHLAYVVGDQASYLRVMIRTGELLEQVAIQQGYEVVRRDLFRTRWATATKEQLNEEVVVLRWPGKG